MDYKETAVILQLVSSTYPKFYKDSSESSIALSIKVWQSIFEEESYEEVVKGLKAYMSHDEGFPPTPGLIKKEIHSKRQLGINSSEAWALVRKAISNGIYGATEEFENLPPTVQRAVGSPEVIHDWSMVEEGQLAYVQRQFMKTYDVLQEEEKETKQLPSSVKKEIPQITFDGWRPQIEGETK